MNRDFRVISPGKINLHLDIKTRRDDGFHGIVSLFHKIDLSDEICIRSLKDECNCRITGDFDCPPDRNLIIRAAELFREISGIRRGYEFRAVKHIPAGAGLGGGSGNAAAVLEALNRINGNPLERDTLFEAGARLGSDVPFFLGGPAALVTGRGEILEGLPALKNVHGVLIVPDLKISTPEAYRLFDSEGRVDDRLGTEQVKNAYIQGGISSWPFFNSFSAVLYRHFPVLEKAESALKEQGAGFSSLSGSGSAVFGLFPSEKAAESAVRRLKNVYIRVWKIKLLAQ